LELAIEESFNEENLIDHETVMSEIQKWMKKE